MSDVFYIGGTKCGALCGEAVVFCGMHAPAHPIPRIKQHGALLAKGRLTGVQFEALFTDGLYFEIGRQAIETAQALRRVLHERGYQFFLETPTNQQFVILPNEDMTSQVAFASMPRLSTREKALINEHLKGVAHGATPTLSAGGVVDRSYWASFF